MEGSRSESRMWNKRGGKRRGAEDKGKINQGWQWKWGGDVI